MKKRKTKIPKTVKRLYNAAYELKKEINKNLPADQQIKKIPGYTEALKGFKPRSMKAARKLVKDFFEGKSYEGMTAAQLRAQVWKLAPSINTVSPTEDSPAAWLQDIYNMDTKDYYRTMSYVEAMGHIAELTKFLTKEDPDSTTYRELDALKTKLKQAYTVNKNNNKKKFKNKDSKFTVKSLGEGV